MAEDNTEAAEADGTADMNGTAVKVLVLVLGSLLIAAIIGGWNLSTNVSAMGADIKHLTTGMGEVKARLWSVEQALRNGK